ncbi:MAG: N-acetylmannosamine kinase [Halioglobus sp.]
MIIGIDIGGTKISAALLNVTEIVEQRSAPSCVHGDLAQLLPTLETLLDGWLEHTRGIGVGSTGLVGAADVHFLSAGPDKRLPLQRLLKQTFGKPVLLLNDAWAAAWGEYRLGQHGDDSTLVFVTVSTGIGGGIIQNGQLVTIDHGFAAHIGHLSVARPGREPVCCTCGRVNCIEALASGTAIGRRASALLGRTVGSMEVFDSLENQPQLQDLAQDCATAIAEMIANIRAVTGTSIVVLGGSVGQNPHFRRLLDKAIQKLPALYHVQVRPPALGAHAGIFGAALALQDSLDG